MHRQTHIITHICPLAIQEIGGKQASLEGKATAMPGLFRQLVQRSKDRPIPNKTHPLSNTNRVRHNNEIISLEYPIIIAQLIE